MSDNLKKMSYGVTSFMRLFGEGYDYVNNTSYIYTPRVDAKR
jgi:hypothetical protein